MKKRRRRKRLKIKPAFNRQHYKYSKSIFQNEIFILDIPKPVKTALKVISKLMAFILNKKLNKVQKTKKS